MKKAWYTLEDLAMKSREAASGRLKVPRALRISEASYEAAKAVNWFEESLGYAEVCEADARLVEAHTSQANGQLLRAGVQSIANGWYEKTQSTYENYTVAVSSDKAYEFYAPKFGVSLPRPMGKLTPAANSNVKFADLQVQNFKFGAILEIESELEEDDQTGQIGTLAGDLGENTKVFEEAYVAGRLVGQAFTIGEDSYAASGYSTTNADGTAISYPFDDQIYTDTVGGNSLGTGTHARTGGVDLTTINLARLRSLMLQGVNPLNVKLLMNPDRLVCGTGYDNKMRLILNSSFYPGTVGATGQTVTTAAAGTIPGVMMDYNPFKTLYQGYVNAYLAQWAWYIGHSTKGLIFQRRSPWAVVMESPNAGDSFSYDKLRWRTRGRFEVEYLEPRYWGQGNDGTVTGTY